MSRLVSLTVPQPCSENWAAMTPAAQGRHCAACNKVVLDFTHKTDAEILTLLRLTTSPCGRFHSGQLGRLLLPPPAPSPRWRTWLTAAATVLGLREIVAEKAQAQQLQTAETLQAKDVRKMAALRRPQQLVVAATSPKVGVLRGRVIDTASGEGLAGATVLLVGTTTGAATSTDGTFELSYSGTTASHVSFSFIGYTPQVMSLEQAAAHSLVALEADGKAMMGELVVVGSVSPRWYTPRGLWQRISRPFRPF